MGTPHMCSAGRHRPNNFASFTSGEIPLRLELFFCVGSAPANGGWDRRQLGEYEKRGGARLLPSLVRATLTSPSMEEAEGPRTTYEYFDIDGRRKRSANNRSNRHWTMERIGICHNRFSHATPLPHCRGCESRGRQPGPDIFRASFHFRFLNPTKRIFSEQISAFPSPGTRPWPVLFSVTH